MLDAEHTLDVSVLLRAAVGDSTIRLGASVQGETQGSLKGKRDWVRSLNRYLKYVSEKVGESPRITTHCFRVHFISSLLNDSSAFTLCSVKTLVGHCMSSTTERYYRYLPASDLESRIGNALNSFQQAKTQVVPIGDTPRSV